MKDEELNGKVSTTSDHDKSMIEIRMDDESVVLPVSQIRRIETSTERVGQYPISELRYKLNIDFHNEKKVIYTFKDKEKREFLYKKLMVVVSGLCPVYKVEI